jgi:hypothetical protein
MAVFRSLTSFITAVLVAGSSTGAAAQGLTAAPSEAAEIGGRLRSFYFNLAHHNWDALTGDILAAKVVAHRPPPQSLLFGKHSLVQPVPSRLVVCSDSDPVSVEQAVISVQGDWAEVTVPHCAPVLGWDEFRLIRFGGRWRFVAVHLFQRASDVTSGR